jgi:hypothetical protein
MTSNVEVLRVSTTARVGPADGDRLTSCAGNPAVVGIRARRPEALRPHLSVSLP